MEQEKLLVRERLKKQISASNSDEDKYLLFINKLEGIHHIIDYCITDSFQQADNLFF